MTTTTIETETGTTGGRAAAGPAIRPATAADARGLHALITRHQTEGHLLPRTLDDLRRHAGRFVVFEVEGAIEACAELAPLSPALGEIRSLVVAGPWRGAGVATRLVDELRTRARAAGYHTVCAFTRDVRFFIGQSFSITPHAWLPEKIAKDCSGCPLFRGCGQSAMLLPLAGNDDAGSARTGVVDRAGAA